MSTPKRALQALAIVLVLSALLALAQHLWAPSADSHWSSLIPALIAIAVAFATHHVQAALLCAIAVGSLLSQPLLQIPGHFLGSVSAPLTDLTNLKILSFMVLLIPGLNIVLKAGGIQEILRRFASWAQSRKSTQLATIALGLLVFIDDYANTWLVGAAMQDPAKKANLSKAKLSFLVDATSAPIAGVAFVSTWIGYEIGLFQKILTELAVGMDPYLLFLDALPFRFYCWMMLGFVILVAVSGRDFGSMLVAERKALDSTTSSQSDNSNDEAVGRLGAKSWGALISLGTLFLCIFGGFLIQGGALSLWDEGLRGTLWLRTLLSNVDSIAVLAWSSVAFFCVSVLTTLFFAKRPPKNIGKDFLAGLKTSLLPLTILILSWGLKGSLESLGASEFLRDTFAQNTSPLLFPALVFLLASITAFCTGTSWGTMAILIPTLVPLAFALEGSQFGLISIITCAAVLDGAIFGDHCSPISDTSIMSASATGCDVMEHVRTQLPYAVFVALFVSTIAYTSAAAGVTPLIAFGGSFLLMAATFWKISKAPAKL